MRSCAHAVPSFRATSPPTHQGLAGRATCSPRDPACSASAILGAARATPTSALRRRRKQTKGQECPVLAHTAPAMMEVRAPLTSRSASSLFYAFPRPSFASATGCISVTAPLAHVCSLFHFRYRFAVLCLPLTTYYSSCLKQCRRSWEPKEVARRAPSPDTL